MQRVSLLLKGRPFAFGIDRGLVAQQLGSFGDHRRGVVAGMYFGQLHAALEHERAGAVRTGRWRMRSIVIVPSSPALVVTS